MSGQSTPAQKRAQQMRSLLGSIGAASSHAYSTIKMLEAERKHDSSLKTHLNELMEVHLKRLQQQLIETEKRLQILNAHYRNYEKPTPTKWEKMIAKEEAEDATRQQNLNSTVGQQQESQHQA